MHLNRFCSIMSAFARHTIIKRLKALWPFLALLFLSLVKCDNTRSARYALYRSESESHWLTSNAINIAFISIIMLPTMVSLMFVRWRLNAKTHHLRCLNGGVVFSGIQPTGLPHFGNYASAIKQWVTLQQQYNCVFAVVDLHTVTLPIDPAVLRENVLSMTACLLACGIDPEASILFQQSQVPEHTQLAWLLSCLCLLTKLNNLTHWKDKMARMKHPAAGLYTYPILQAADILLYKAIHVPVGDDQLTHIDIARDLAQSFNTRYGRFFPLPSPIISNVSKIKSLVDPSVKMSKSDRKVASRINLDDEPDAIRSKIKKAVTDFNSRITFDPIQRPGVSNLILIHSAISGKTPRDICVECESLDTLGYKMLVADVVIEELSPIRAKMADLLRDGGYLRSVLESGGERARSIAADNLNRVHQLVGMRTEKLNNIQNVSV